MSTPQANDRESIPGRDHPDVLAVCRWLPQPYPWGAFTGRHDYVHVSERQGRVNLWWSQNCVHAGDYVGPPRGGLVPHARADYDVAMPSGGYLQVRNGVLTDWCDDRDDTSPTSAGRQAAPVVRADGEVFRGAKYGPANPYWLSDYRAMTDEDRRNALAGVRHLRDREGQDHTADAAELVAAISVRVTSAAVPDMCSCAQPDRDPPSRGMDVPGALLGNSAAIAVLTGAADARTARDVVWALTRELADPEQAGLVRAAEVAARRANDSVAGWPDGPLTEESVALVAAQALRWHGHRIAGELPFWVLGWIFVARPVLESLLPDSSQTERNRIKRETLRLADQVRVERVAQTWAAAHQADRMLQRFATIADSPTTVTVANAVIDLRDRSTAKIPEPATPDAYERSVAAVLAQLAP